MKVKIVKNRHFIAQMGVFWDYKKHFFYTFFYRMRAIDMNRPRY